MADPYNPNPFQTQSGGGISSNSFEDWYNQYYGGNNSGYRPQNRLSDLVRPQSFQYSNANFTQPQQQYQPQYQAPQQFYTLPAQYEHVTGNGTKYMDEGTYNSHTSAIDNADDPFDKMAAYKRLMRGL